MIDMSLFTPPTICKRAKAEYDHGKEVEYRLQRTIARLVDDIIQHNLETKDVFEQNSQLKNQIKLLENKNKLLKNKNKLLKEDVSWLKGEHTRLTLAYRRIKEEIKSLEGNLTVEVLSLDELTDYERQKMILSNAQYFQ